MICPICKADENYELPDIYDNAKGIKGHKVWCPDAKLPMIGDTEKEAEKMWDTELKDDLEAIEKALKEAQLDDNKKNNN